MQGLVPIGTILSALLWLFVIPALLILILRQYKKKFLEDKKDSIGNPEDKFMKEIKEAYNKLSEEQKRKIDSHFNAK